MGCSGPRWLKSTRRFSKFRYWGQFLVSAAQLLNSGVKSRHHGYVFRGSTRNGTYLLSGSLLSNTNNSLIWKSARTSEQTKAATGLVIDRRPDPVWGPSPGNSTNGPRFDLDIVPEDGIILQTGIGILEHDRKCPLVTRQPA